MAEIEQIVVRVQGGEIETYALIVEAYYVFKPSVYSEYQEFEHGLREWRILTRKGVGIRLF